MDVKQIETEMVLAQTLADRDRALLQLAAEVTRLRAEAQRRDDEQKAKVEKNV